MPRLIDYIAKSLTSKKRQSWERQAKYFLEPWKGSKELFSSVSSGRRKRSRILGHYNEWPVMVKGERFAITTMQINRMSKQDSAAAGKLFDAITAKGKAKPRNKRAILEALVPICLACN